MRWDEIDIAAATWTLPPERQKKTGVAHIIPLSREALKILEEITKFRTQSEYVFPGRSWRKPISANHFVTHAARRDIARLAQHFS